MPPTLVLIRHAEALHNVDPANHALPDPDLTEHGRKQAAELGAQLRARLPRDRRVRQIVTSPMRRTVQTALLALDWLLEGKGEGGEEGAGRVPIVADARWQELYPKPCDTGTRVEKLAAEFPQVDFSRVDPAYPDKTGSAGARYRFERGAVLARAQSALADLYGDDGDKDGDIVVVVSHSGFLRTAVAGRWFANADYRIFDYAPRQSDDEPFRLVEWEQTAGKGGMGWSMEELVELGTGLPEA